MKRQTQTPCCDLARNTSSCLLSGAPGKDLPFPSKSSKTKPLAELSVCSERTGDVTRSVAPVTAAAVGQLHPALSCRDGGTRSRPRPWEPGIIPVPDGHAASNPSMSVCAWCRTHPWLAGSGVHSLSLPPASITHHISEAATEDTQGPLVSRFPKCSFLATQLVAEALGSCRTMLHVPLSLCWPQGSHVVHAAAQLMNQLAHAYRDQRQGRNWIQPLSSGSLQAQTNPRSPWCEAVPDFCLVNLASTAWSV